MKKIFLIAPFVVAALILAAHFFRIGQLPIVSICLGFPAILLYKKPAALFMARAFMVVAILEWGKTTAQFIVERMDAGTDWTRFALIMGCVIAFNIIALVILCVSKTLKETYLKG